MDIIKYRKWWYILSLVIIVPGLISLALWGLKPSIDFTGGTQIEFSGTKDKAKVELVVKKTSVSNPTVTLTDGGVIVRTKTVDVTKQNELKAMVEKEIPGTKQIQVDTVGPSISAEVTS